MALIKSTTKVQYLTVNGSEYAMDLPIWQTVGGNVLTPQQAARDLNRGNDYGGGLTYEALNDQYADCEDVLTATVSDALFQHVTPTAGVWTLPNIANTVLVPFLQKHGGVIDSKVKGPKEADRLITNASADARKRLASVPVPTTTDAAGTVAMSDQTADQTA